MTVAELRDAIANGDPIEPKDLKDVGSEDLVDTLDYAYTTLGLLQTIVMLQGELIVRLMKRSKNVDGGRITPKR